MTRRLALWAGLLAMMAAGSAAPGLRTMETEEVDAAEWAALEQAMAMAGATGNTTATAPRVTHAGNSTGAGGAVWPAEGGPEASPAQFRHEKIGLCGAEWDQ